MSRIVLLGLWSLCLAVLLLCLLLSRSGRLARVGQMRAALTSSVPRMVVLLLGWAWLGWHFFAR